MCGIVGYAGKNGNSLKVLIDGLHNLEYRGYDSSGICILKDNDIYIEKEKGRIKNLEEKLDFNIKSNIGLGHTRWATHGVPNKINSHPHTAGKITIVHNGIIENYKEIKDEFKDYNFISDTDTEVAAVLLNDLYNKTNNMIKAIELFKEKARGAYAIGIINTDFKDRIFAIKKNSPLIIGINKDENYIASDVPAILEFTNKYMLLEDDEYAIIKSDEVIVYDKDNKITKKEVKTFNGDKSLIDKNGYDHFMIKEINEEPEVIKKTLNSILDNNKINLDKYFKKNYKKICILGCGSAIHAGMIGKYLIEEYANIEVDVEIASEFRYKANFFDEDTLIIPISQSGETADTLEALKLTKSKNCDSLGIINVKESSIARICDNVIYTLAGPEIAVATTKAYIAQVLVLSLIAIYLGRKNNKLTKKDEENLINELKSLPININSIINKDLYKKIANDIYNEEDIFFIGRNVDYALCMEGSLKLKEISYIHSEAYAAGELKHGTISLIDNNTPVFAVVTKDSIKEKTISNIKEVKARGAKVILVTNDTNIDKEIYDILIEIPKTNDLIQNMLTIVPLQVLSYEIAKLRGCDIDKPKNLAKSVTVE